MLYRFLPKIFLTNLYEPSWPPTNENLATALLWVSRNQKLVSSLGNVWTTLACTIRNSCEWLGYRLVRIIFLVCSLFAKPPLSGVVLGKSCGGVKVFCILLNINLTIFLSFIGVVEHGRSYIRNWWGPGLTRFLRFPM